MSTRDEKKMDATLKALGREIRAERTRMGVSRETLADVAGISARQLGKIERGEAGQIVEVWRVAEVVGVPLSDLLRSAEESSMAERRTS